MSANKGIRRLGIWLALVAMTASVAFSALHLAIPPGQTTPNSSASAPTPAGQESLEWALGQICTPFGATDSSREQENGAPLGAVVDICGHCALSCDMLGKFIPRTVITLESLPREKKLSAAQVAAAIPSQSSRAQARAPPAIYA